MEQDSRRRRSQVSSFSATGQAPDFSRSPYGAYSPNPANQTNQYVNPYGQAAGNAYPQYDYRAGGMPAYSGSLDYGGGANGLQEQRYVQSPAQTKTPRQQTANGTGHVVAAGEWYNPGPQPVRKAAKSTSFSAGRKTSAGNGGRRAANVRQSKGPRNTPWKLITVLVIVGVLGLAGLIGYSELKNKLAQVSRYDSVYLPGVYVDGISLAGMSRAEAEKAVRSQLQEKKSSWYVSLVAPNGASKSITADSLGIDWNPDAALSEAWEVGHSSYGGQFIFSALKGKQAELDSALSQEHHFSSAQQSADLQRLDEILSSIEKAFYRAPVDAAFLGFDPDNREKPFSFQSEQAGQRLNTEAARQEIQALVDDLQSGTVYLTVSEIAPAVTVSDLSVAYQLRFKAITPISSHSTEERTDNIRIAFSKINGLTLDNGKKFSFNKVVGKRSLANGFHAAVEYVYGQETEGIGGGVCQASTTVYLAAVQSGMNITKRVPHSMAVSYTELGLDATVSDTKGHEIDFTFRNDSGYPIYITAHVITSPTSSKKLMCEVAIYGYSLGNTRYEVTTQTVETIPKPEEPTRVKDKKAEYVVYEDEEKTVAKGREGYVVESYLITYESNIEVDRKLLYTDTYPAKADTVYVGVTKRGN